MFKLMTWKTHQNELFNVFTVFTSSEYLSPLDTKKYKAKAITTVVSANELKTRRDYNTVLQNDITFSNNKIMDTIEVPLINQIVPETMSKSF